MSENILKELCNRLLSLFKQTETKEDNAKDIACNRLRVVLMQDRTNLTPELLQRMRRELIELLSKYVEMDKDALELNFDQEGDQMALMLSIPVIRAKDEEEIEKALAEEDSKKEEDEDDDASDEEIGEREEANEEDNDNDDETSEEEVEDEVEDDVEEEETEPEIVEEKTEKTKKEDKE
ncbi:cell division topological specificity factor MinE [bacterium]|nr:cell division topological specificity factor MinE [bacterium]